MMLSFNNNPRLTKFLKVTMSYNQATPLIFNEMSN